MKYLWNTKSGRLLLALGFMIMVCETVDGQQITFQKTFGGDSSDYCWEVRQTTDGGYIICGTTYSFGAGNADVYVIKTNSFGDTLWIKTYGGTNDDEGYSVKQTMDGGYIVVGYTISFGGGSYDVYLIKTDVNGDTLWTKTYGGAASESGYSVQQNLDRGFIITGRANSNVYLIKTDSLGNILWTKTYNQGSNGANSVQQTMDGGYIVCGYATGGAFLIKTDSIGDTLWFKTYGGTNQDYGWSVQQTTDSGYIIVGNTSSFGVGFSNLYIIKTNINGDTLWSKTYGGTYYESGYSVQQTTDGGYIIAGSSESFSIDSSSKAYLVKTNSTGDLQWSKIYGETGNVIATSVRQTIDGGYIIGGYGYFGTGLLNIYLIKTDSLGNSGCNQKNAGTIQTSPATQVTNVSPVINSDNFTHNTQTIVGNGGIVTTLCTNVGIPEIADMKNVSIYPNPNDGNFSLSYHLSSSKNELLIIDVFGRTVYSSVLTSQEGTQNIVVSTLSSGIYYWEVVSEGGVEGKGKLAVIK